MNNLDSPLSGRRVLIVEDDALISWEMADFLANAGAEVLGPAATVGAAMALLADQRPHGAVLDLNLRGERSTPIAEALQTSAIPFVLVTGYSRSQIEEPLLRDAPIVPKPMDSKLLLDTVQRLFTDCA